MPMLTTLRIGLPVWPFHAPERTRSANARMRPQHPVHLGHDVLAVDDQRRRLGHAQRHVQHRAVLGDVDAVAAEHGVDALAQPALVGQLQQRRTVSSVMRFFE